MRQQLKLGKKYENEPYPEDSPLDKEQNDEDINFDRAMMENCQFEQRMNLEQLSRQCGVNLFALKNPLQFFD